MDKCEVCIRLKRPKPHPIVGLLLATRFNETSNGPENLGKCIFWFSLIWQQNFVQQLS